MDQKISELHAAYCEASGFDLPLRMGRDRVWFDFEKAGFTKDDLLLVIAWIKRQLGRNNGYSQASLKFTTLIVQLDIFEEKLLLARKESRVRPARTLAQQTRVLDLGNGETVSVLDPDAPQGDGIATSRDAASEFFRDLSRQIREGPTGSRPTSHFQPTAGEKPAPASVVTSGIRATDAP